MMMLPFVASQAIALKKAKQKSVDSARPNSEQRSADAPVRTVRKGVFRRFLDVLIESRLRGADGEIKRHRRWIGADGNK
jgi:hypothetical protein